jgi:hypothetical protein
MRLALGRHARCTDGTVRVLVDLVVDAGSRSVTHLVVQPADDPDAARLVPVDLASAGADGNEISLGCTAPELEQLPRVHEHTYLGLGARPEETEDDNWDVGVRDMQVVPDYAPEPFGVEVAQEAVISYDRVPKGEIELRHASSVYSADEHHLGSVVGVVVGADGLIGHVLLERGHLWWKREISIPASAVAELANDMVTLGIEKSELESVSSERRS